MNVIANVLPFSTSDQFRCNKQNTKLKSDEIRQQCETFHVYVQQVGSNVECAMTVTFLNTLVE
jgi:hypothetical protein